MPFPNTVTNVDIVNHGLPGPWLAPNGARYLVLDAGGGDIDIWKSTDLGVTWAVVDVANSPLQTITASVLNGSRIYAIGNDTFTAVDNLRVSVFNTATDLWESSTLNPNANSGDTGRFLSVVFRSSDSQLVIAGTPLSLKVGGLLRTGYLLFDTGALTFSAWVRTGETGASTLTWECDAILQGVGEVDFLFFSYVAPSNTGIRAIWRQPLSDAGALGAKVQIGTITDGGASNVTPYGFSDGVNAVVVWVPTNLAPLAMAVWSGPVSTWALVSQSLNAPNTETEIDDVAAIQSPTAGLVVFFATTAPGFAGNFWISTDVGGGLSVPSLLGTIPFWNSGTDSLWANALGGVAPPWGIVIWNVSDATYYWETSATPPPPPPVLTFTPLQFTIFAFPYGPDCCSPCGLDVACVMPSGNGNVYVPAKGPLKRI